MFDINMFSYACVYSAHFVLITYFITKSEFLKKPRMLNMINIFCNFIEIKNWKKFDWLNYLNTDSQIILLKQKY